MLKFILIVAAAACFAASALSINLKIGSKTIQTTPLGYCLLTIALLLIA